MYWTSVIASLMFFEGGGKGAGLDQKIDGVLKLENPLLDEIATSLLATQLY